MPNLPIPRAHFCVPLNPDAHPNNKFSKIAQHNHATPLPEQHNKWESASHINEHYVIVLVAIPYPGYNNIITIVSNEEKTYLVSIIDICPNFTKCHMYHWGSEVNGFHANTCITCLDIYAKLTMPMRNSYTSSCTFLSSLVWRSSLGVDFWM